jgi:hypothetical protein
MTERAYSTSQTSSSCRKIGAHVDLVIQLALPHGHAQQILAEVEVSDPQPDDLRDPQPRLDGQRSQEPDGWARRPVMAVTERIDLR